MPQWAFLPVGARPALLLALGSVSRCAEMPVKELGPQSKTQWQTEKIGRCCWGPVLVDVFNITCYSQGKSARYWGAASRRSESEGHLAAQVSFGGEHKLRGRRPPPSSGMT